MEPLGQQDKKKKSKPQEESGKGGGVMKKSPGSQSSCQKDLQDYDPSRNALS